MTIEKKINELHEKCSKLSANELIDLLNSVLHLESTQPKLIKIVKIYLKRALEKEGIQ